MQEAASLTCHPSWLRMDSSDVDPIWYMVPWIHISQSETHRDWFTRFSTAQPCVQHTNTQTTLRVTTVAIGRISCTACRQKTKQRVWIEPALASLCLTFVEVARHTVMQFGPVGVKTTHPAARVPAEQPLSTAAVTAVAALPASPTHTRSRNPGHRVTHQVPSERRAACLLRVQEHQHVVVGVETERPRHVLIREYRIHGRQIQFLHVPRFHVGLSPFTRKSCPRWWGARHGGTQRVWTEVAQKDYSGDERSQQQHYQTLSTFHETSH